MPKTIYDVVGVRKELVDNKRVFVPIYQTNRQVINLCLRNVEITEAINKYSFTNAWLNETISGMNTYLSWLNQQVENT